MGDVWLGQRSSEGKEAQCLGGPAVLGISFPRSCVLRVQGGCQVGGVECVPSWSSAGMVRYGSGEVLPFLKAVN